MDIQNTFLKGEFKLYEIETKNGNILMIMKY